MLIAAAVCPHPPPLAPAAIGAAAGDRAPALGDELMVAGRAAWQVIAGAADGARLQGRLLCLAGPYGVSYLVAAWAEPGAG